MSGIIETYENEVIDIYKNENLVALRDNEYIYNGIAIHDILSISKKSDLTIPNFNSTKNLWDIVNCNSDLRHFTSLLFYYRPFINNPESEKVKNDNSSFYTYFQNLHDRRFSQFASICFEKLYNYCDRIGDLLAYYYPTKFQKIRNIYFTSVIDILKTNPDFKTNEYFKKIQSYREITFKEINESRREIVHYYQFETNYRFDFTMNATNEKEIGQLWEFKNKLPEYFKEQLKLSNELYCNALGLIKKTYMP